MEIEVEFAYPRRPSKKLKQRTVIAIYNVEGGYIAPAAYVGGIKVEDESYDDPDVIEFLEATYADDDSEFDMDLLDEKESALLKRKAIKKFFSETESVGVSEDEIESIDSMDGFNVLDD